MNYGDNMDYRFTDPTQVREQLRKQDALSADVQAYALECDLRMLDPAVDDPERWTSLAKAIEVQRTEAEKRKAAEKVTDIEVVAARRQFLENWIKNIENKHAEATAARELKAARKESTLEEERALPKLEHSWTVATSLLDELDGAQAVPSAPPRAERRRAEKAAKTNGKATTASKTVVKRVAKKPAPSGS